MSGSVSNRVTLMVNGASYSQFTSGEITRDLQQISGTFRLECLDAARAFAALGGAAPGSSAQPLKTGQACTIALDGETVLMGYVNKVQLRWTGGELSCEICGRDRAGDLIDCSPVPNGPGEFHNVDLLYVANAICAPFGIKVAADVDVGAPFTVLAMQPYERAMEALEKAARQRAVLVTSDGVGGLLLTRGGSTRAPAPLRVGQNVQAVETTHGDEQRFSDYYVKGQSKRGAGAAPAMNSASSASGAAAATTPGTLSATEAQSTVMSGHAIDAEITRYRPTVRMVKTQSGMSTVQEQADWALRVARGQSDRLVYRVLDWRAMQGGALWRPNQVAAVYDPYTGINHDMLIAGCAYTISAQGLATSIRMVGVTAYDLVNTTIRQRGPTTGMRQQYLTTPVKPISAP